MYVCMHKRVLGAYACVEPPSLQQNLLFPTDKVEGETLSVQCTASRGDLPIEFSWKLNGERIQLHDARGIQTQVRYFLHSRQHLLLSSI